MRTLDHGFSFSDNSDFEKEHVTLWMRNACCWSYIIFPTIFRTDNRYPADLERIEKLIGSRDPVTVDYRELMSETT